MNFNKYRGYKLEIIGRTVSQNHPVRSKFHIVSV